MATGRSNPKPERPKRPPATTPEGRENQLIALSYDAAETQIRAGRATSQLLTHFLKLGSTREELEKERLRRENLLLQAKVEELGSHKRSEELYAEALKAMRAYSGHPSDDDANDQMLYRSSATAKPRGTLQVLAASFASWRCYFRFRTIRQSEVLQLYRMATRSKRCHSKR